MNLVTGELHNKDVRAALASRLAGVHFTPIEKEIMFVLADGLHHPVKDLIEAVGGSRDEEKDKDTLQIHVVNIRKKVAFLGDDIVCVFAERRTNYRYITTLLALLKESKPTL